MTVAIDTTSPEGATEAAPETKEQVWTRLMNPISKEDVKGLDPKAEAPKVPDRVLVAPKLVEKLAPKAESPLTPLEERLARIEQALKPEEAPPPAPALEDEVRALREAILAKEEEAAQAAAEAAEAEDMNLLREGVVSNIRGDAERFPLLVGLGQEENVFHELVNQIRAGKQVSEDDIASQAEARLQAAFEKMLAAKNGGKPTTSQEPAQSVAPKTPTTLTPALTAADKPGDVESILAETGDRRQAMVSVWDKVMNG